MSSYDFWKLESPPEYRDLDDAPAERICDNCGGSDAEHVVIAERHVALCAGCQIAVPDEDATAVLQ